MFEEFGLHPVKIFFSAREAGQMKFSETGGDEQIRANRGNFLHKNGIDPAKLISVDLVHGINVAMVKKNNAGTFIPKTDGLITSEKNLFLSVTVADCLPIFLSDINSRFVGLLHCGWRGLSSRIIERGIELIKKIFK